MRQTALLARLCNLIQREQSSNFVRQAEIQCRAFCGCSHSSKSSLASLPSWQSPSSIFSQQQSGHRLLQSSTAASLLQHHQYASGAGQEESLIQDEAEVRELGSPRVKRIVEEIVNLNLLEVADLVEILRVRLGLGPDSYGMQMPMAAAQPAPGGAAPATDAAAAALPAEKTEFNVKLEGFDAAAKIKVIKEVRAITGLGLKEAKEMVMSIPWMAPYQVMCS